MAIEAKEAKKRFGGENIFREAFLNRGAFFMLHQALEVRVRGNKWIRMDSCVKFWVNIEYAGEGLGGKGREVGGGRRMSW